MSWAEDTAKRRAQVTGESYEVALAAVTAERAEMDAVLAAGPKDWLEGYLAEPDKPVNDEIIAWMRSRPAVVMAAMRKFPPRCVVRSKEGFEHVVPQAGGVGILMSYAENGTVGVVPWPEGPITHPCRVDELELVGSWRGWTPERIAAILGEASS